LRRGEGIGAPAPCGRIDLLFGEKEYYPLAMLTEMMDIIILGDIFDQEQAS
jgi:hypothetical protein